MKTAKPTHPAMERLYWALLELGLMKATHRQSAFARLLNTTPQRVKNWEERGPSKDVCLEVQERFGINATWVSSMSGHPFLRGVGPSEADPGATGLSAPSKENRIARVQDAVENILKAADLAGEFELHDVRGRCCFTAEQVKAAMAELWEESGEELRAANTPEFAAKAIGKKLLELACVKSQTTSKQTTNL